MSARASHAHHAYSHDQPDNGRRMIRLKVARVMQTRQTTPMRVRARLKSNVGEPLLSTRSRSVAQTTQPRRRRARGCDALEELYERTAKNYSDPSASTPSSPPQNRFLAPALIGAAKRASSAAQFSPTPASHPPRARWLAASMNRSNSSSDRSLVGSIISAPGQSSGSYRVGGSLVDQPAWQCRRFHALGRLTLVAENHLVHEGVL